MAACAPLEFNGITRSKFQAIRARLNAEAHLELVGDAGTATGSGVTATFSYDEAAQSLTIQCTAKPFFVTESFVAGKIQQLVDSVSG